MSGLRFAYKQLSGWKWFRGPAGGEPIVGASVVPGSTWRARLGGFGGSSRSETDSMLEKACEPPGGCTAIVSRWVDLQPSPGALDPTAVATLVGTLGWAAEKGLPVLLRLDTIGVEPEWLTARFWEQPWTEAYAALLGLLVAEPGVGDAAMLSAFAMTGAALNHGFTDDAVRAEAAAAGYTTEADIASSQSIIDAHAGTFGQVQVGGRLLLQQHEGIADDGTLDVSIDRATALGQYAIDTLGGMCMLGLTGFTGKGITSGLYPWASAQAADHPLHVRLATLSALTAAKATAATALETAATLGAASVEVGPMAAAGWDLALSSQMHARLRENL